MSCSFQLVSLATRDHSQRLAHPDLLDPLARQDHPVRRERMERRAERAAATIAHLRDLPLAIRPHSVILLTNKAFGDINEATE